MLIKYTSLSEIEDEFMHGTISKYNNYVILMKIILPEQK